MISVLFFIKSNLNSQIFFWNELWTRYNGFDVPFLVKVGVINVTLNQHIKNDTFPIKYCYFNKSPTLVDLWLYLFFFFVSFFNMRVLTHEWNNLRNGNDRECSLFTVMDIYCPTTTYGILLRFFAHNIFRTLEKLKGVWSVWSA